MRVTAFQLDELLVATHLQKDGTWHTIVRSPEYQIDPSKLKQLQLPAISPAVTVQISKTEDEAFEAQRLWVKVMTFDPPDELADLASPIDTGLGQSLAKLFGIAESELVEMRTIKRRPLPAEPVTPEPSAN